jgi:hypothetical protein
LLAYSIDDLIADNLKRDYNRIPVNTDIYIAVTGREARSALKQTSAKTKLREVFGQTTPVLFIPNTTYADIVQAIFDVVKDYEGLQNIDAVSVSE